MLLAIATTMNGDHTLSAPLLLFQHLLVLGFIEKFPNAVAVAVFEVVLGLVVRERTAPVRDRTGADLLSVLCTRAIRPFLVDTDQFRVRRVRTARELQRPRIETQIAVLADARIIGALVHAIVVDTVATHFARAGMNRGVLVIAVETGIRGVVGAVIVTIDVHPAALARARFDVLSKRRHSQRGHRDCREKNRQKLLHGNSLKTLWVGETNPQRRGHFEIPGTLLKPLRLPRLWGERLSYSRKAIAPRS